MIPHLPQPPFASFTQELLYFIARGRPDRGAKVLHYLEASGDFEATGDYSTSPKTFSRRPPVGQDWALTSIQVSARYARSPGEVARPDLYPGLPLTGGYDIAFVAPGQSGRLNAAPIRRPTDLMQSGFDLGFFQLPAAPEAGSWCATLDLLKTFGAPFVLDQSQRIEVNLQDDFSGLDAHRFLLTGYVL